MIYVVYNALLITATAALSPILALLLLIKKKYRYGLLHKSALRIGPYRTEMHKPDPVWIHAVSVGEVMAAQPLVRMLKQRHPDMPVCLSTVTQTGYYTAQHNVKAADRIVCFPFDYPFIMRRVVTALRPRLFVMMEAEIWPNLLKELSGRSIHSVIVSGRISRDSFKQYRLFRFFFRRVLSNISRFCMQSETDAQRIISMGAPPACVSVAGNIKFDQLIPSITPEQKQLLYKQLHVDLSRPVFIAGSTHRGDEEIVLDAYESVKERYPGLVLIIAPRHPERFDEVDELLQRRGCQYIRRTALSASSAQGAPPIILLDTIGELAKVYSIGTVIFVGGTILPGVGGHNMLEPAVFSKPVIFGPHTENFTEVASILTEHRAAVRVLDTPGLIASLDELLSDPERRRTIGAAAFSAIEKNSGAVQRCMEHIESLLHDA